MSCIAGRQRILRSMTILGFVSDAYLDGLDTGTAVMVAELCSAGVWERAEGGYRILDRDAVGRCQDLARQLSGEAARVRARIRARDHARAQLLPEMAEAIVVSPPCAACGAPATRIELVAPGQLPAQWEQWPRTVRDSFLAAPRARPVVPDSRRRGRRQRLRESGRRRGRRADRPGVAASAAL